jgi:hypothetical protein
MKIFDRSDATLESHFIINATPPHQFRGLFLPARQGAWGERSRTGLRAYGRSNQVWSSVIYSPPFGRHILYFALPVGTRPKGNT